MARATRGGRTTSQVGAELLFVGQDGAFPIAVKYGSGGAARCTGVFHPGRRVVR